jgi:aryl-alcohol dehydrogenase-like predicted oxidoreductase
MTSHRIQGFATPDGTSRYFKARGWAEPGRDKRVSTRLAPVRLGRTELEVSRVGFGCYRITEEDPVHRESLIQALENGCNLIDTSANYWLGASERLVGQVLSERIHDGKLKRDEIVVVTKAGYLQGENFTRAKQREAEGRPFPEMVRYAENLWHCISPEFLEDQLNRSLERLQLECVDAFLLHNPEYYLDSGGNPEEYYRRIGNAFTYLETQVKAGRIRWYGISSNTFPEPAEDPHHTSLERVLSVAGPHFGVIQFPMNLFEAGAALNRNNHGKTILELAREQKLGTLVNRPLNSRRRKQLVRLADPSPHREIQASRRPIENIAPADPGVATALSEFCPALKSSPTLSRKCVRIYLSLTGIDTVLLGMRRPQYVDDALALDPLLSPEEAFRTFEKAQSLA